jgi:hypothetical protein
MANESKLPGLPPDYPAAVRLLWAFLEGLLRESEGFRSDISRQEWVYLVVTERVSEAIEAAFIVASEAPPDFPKRQFVTKILPLLEDLGQVCSRIRRGYEEGRSVGVPWLFLSGGKLEPILAAFTADYAEFRGPLKMLQLDAERDPKRRIAGGTVAGEGVEAKRKAHAALPPPVQRVGEEYGDVLAYLRRQDEAEGREPEERTDAELYRALQELCSEESGREPSQSEKTWLKYLGQFRKAIGQPKRRRWAT